MICVTSLLYIPISQVDEERAWLVQDSQHGDGHLGENVDKDLR